MQVNLPSADAGVVKTPYFEAVVRSFVRTFGDDALEMIDRTIEGLETNGPDFALEIWRDIRLTLLRKTAAEAAAMLQ